MDIRQKSALRSQQRKIAEDLVLDEDFYASLRRDKIFSSNMLEMIKAEVKPRDRVYAMLQLLEKRGPDAFDKFVSILREHYSWLADILEDEYKKRLQDDSCLSRTGLPQRQQRDLHYSSSFSPRTYSTNNDSKTETGIVLSKPEIHIQANRTISQQDSEDADNCNGNQEPDRERYKPSGFTKAYTSFLKINIASANNETDGERTHKDACISPIGVIESPRKKVNAMCSPIHKTRVTRNNTSENAYFSYGQENHLDSHLNYNEIYRSERKWSDDGDLTNDVSDEVDGIEHGKEVGNDVQTVEDVFESEDKEDTNLSEQGNNIHEQEYECRNIAKENEYDCAHPYVECEHQQALTQLTDLIKSLHDKLAAVNSKNEENPECVEISEIEESSSEAYSSNTWRRMEDEVDKLINKLQTSDDMKTMQERIHKLNSEKANMESELKKTQKNAENMIDEIYDLRRDRRDIQKIRDSKNELAVKIKELEESFRTKERDFQIKLSQKDHQIQELERTLKEVAEKQEITSPRRSKGGKQKKTSGSNGQHLRLMNIDRSLDPRWTQRRTGANSTIQKSVLLKR